jgi:Flp pilus assembly protein TadD
MDQDRNRSRIADQCRRRSAECLRTGNLDGAVAALRYALDLQPRCHKSWNDLGVVMEALGNPEEALRCYKRSLALQPAHPESRSNLALLSLQLAMCQAMGRQAFTSSMAW